MAHVEGLTTFRGRFEQSFAGTVILKITEFDGTPIDAEDVVHTITRVEDDEVIQTGCVDHITTGCYAAEWDVGASETPGKYLVTWTYTVDDEDFTELQSIIVTESCNSTTHYTGRVLLMRQSLELMIDCAQHVPVYDQQPKSSADNKKYTWTRPRWNTHSGTRIYRNGNIVTEGFSINYFKGMVEFDTPLTAYDTLTADYNFRWFSDEHLDRFMSNAMHMVNIFPPHTSYSIQMMPDKYIGVILWLAAVDAIRHLMMCLQFEEPIQFFGGREDASKRFAQFETLKKNYESMALKALEQKKLGPYVGLTRAVVTPEFTLPGGRSRWFRYLFKGGSGV